MDKCLKDINKTSRFRVITLFILFQPLIDILTSLGTRFGLAITFGVIFRAAFMITLVGYTLFFTKAKEKRYFLIYFGLVSVYCILFLGNIYRQSDFSFILSNMKELIKTFYFTYVLIGFYQMYLEYHYLISDRILSSVFIIYASIIFVAVITQTSFHAYGYESYGYTGWFYAANEVGGILAILGPITFLYVVDMVLQKNKKSLYILGVITIFLFAFLGNFLGTKVIFIGFSTFLLCFSIISIIRVLINRKKEYIYKLSIFVFAIIVLFIFYLFSPVKRTITQTSNEIDKVNIINYENSSDIIKSEKDISDKEEIMPDNDENKKIQTITHKKTSRVYEIINKLLSNRLLMIEKIQIEYNNSGVVNRLLGIGYKTLPIYENNVDNAIEIDFLSLYYRHGYLGVIVYFLPIIVSLVLIIRFVFYNFKKVIQNDSILSYFFSFFIGIAISSTAGHILVAPAVSIYLAILIVKIDKNNLQNLIE